MPLEELLVRGEPAPILRWGQSVLHRPARPVTTFDAGLWDLLATLFATNRAAQGRDSPPHRSASTLNRPGNGGHSSP